MYDSGFARLIQAVELMILIDASSLQRQFHYSGTGGSDEHYRSRRVQMEGMGSAEGTGSALTEQTGMYLRSTRFL